jgi:dolichyl-diphosphooligosaccharide--protein glycosyltransferase
LTKNIFKIKFFGIKNYSFKVSYVVIIIFLFTLPLVFPENSNWISTVDSPPIIFNGATSSLPTHDWLDTLEWIKHNTPENAVIASWWDYGYWITALSERTTLIDNATLGTWQIQKMANIFFNSPTESWNTLQEWGADYVVVFVSSRQIEGDFNGESLHVLGGGADESKLLWLFRISQNPIDQNGDIIPDSKTSSQSESEYFHDDRISTTDYFWNETLMGNLIPYTVIGYYDPDTRQTYAEYGSGFIPISTVNVKYFSDEQPFKLIYASPSFYDKSMKFVNSVFVYKINSNYISDND